MSFHQGDTLENTTYLTEKPSNIKKKNPKTPQVLQVGLEIRISKAVY